MDGRVKDLTIVMVVAPYDSLGWWLAGVPRALVTTINPNEEVTAGAQRALSSALPCLPRQSTLNMTRSLATATRVNQF